MNEVDHRFQRTELHKLYQALLEDVASFWLQHGIDWEYGGVLTCISEQGALISDHKFMWSQARSVWTFSALYNRVERRPKFLEAATNSVRFLLAHGQDSQGRWVYHTDRRGTVIEGPVSIYADCFAVYGLSEYYRATGDEAVLSAARATFNRVKRRIEESDFSETAPYRLPPGRRAHGVSMIMLEVTNELAQTTKDPALEPLADFYAARIMNHFVRPRRRLLLEFLGEAYQELLPTEGTLVIPGHAIESMWFVLHLARRRQDQALIQTAAEVIRWHLEAGWDPQYGGIFLAIDAEHRQPFLRHADKKLWWPHTEALYALLLAHELTGAPWCLDWYRKVHDWSFAHYPIPGIGEWYQRLNRTGEPISEVIALPVKDPFHLPRAAILILQLLKGSTED